MTTDITELAQSLKAAAENATPGEWWADEVKNEGCYGSGDDCVEGFISYAIYGSDGQTLFDSLNSDSACISEEYDGEGHVAWDETAQRNAEFIALANPANILALVEALEKAQCAGSINNQWKPDVCPITGRRFFLWIEHPEFGYVPTYGGPYDSYTIPTRDSDGEFSCERYDHDFGGWVDGECVGAYLIDDDEQSRVYELEQRIAELESRTVTMKLPNQTEFDDPLSAYEAIEKCKDALAAAGIKVEAE